jgi:hypothetical protein
MQNLLLGFLICAVAIKNGWEIFTENADFFGY